MSQAFLCRTTFATVLQDATKQIVNYGILCTKTDFFSFRVKSSKPCVVRMKPMSNVCEYKQTVFANALGS